MFNYNLCKNGFGAYGCSESILIFLFSVKLYQASVLIVLFWFFFSKNTTKERKERTYQASELILDCCMFHEILDVLFLIWTTMFNNSVLKLILYGPLFRMNQSYPGNIGNWSLHYSQGRGNTDGGCAEAGGRLQVSLDYFWDPVPGILWHVQSQEIAFFFDFCPY